MERKDGKAKSSQSRSTKTSPKTSRKKVEPVVAEVKTGPIDKEHQKMVQKLQKQIAQLEEKMGQTQSDLKSIELKMADPSIYSDIAGFKFIEQEYQSKQQAIQQMNQDYDQLFNELLEIESK
jgi:ATP-binding cassette subfamily F protein 3